MGISDGSLMIRGERKGMVTPVDKDRLSIGNLYDSLCSHWHASIALQHWTTISWRILNTSGYLSIPGISSANLRKANKTGLHRVGPSQESTLQLLQRDYFQVAKQSTLHSFQFATRQSTQIYMSCLEMTKFEIQTEIYIYSTFGLDAQPPQYPILPMSRMYIYI